MWLCEGFAGPRRGHSKAQFRRIVWKSRLNGLFNWYLWMYYIYLAFSFYFSIFFFTNFWNVYPYTVEYSLFLLILLIVACNNSTSSFTCWHGMSDGHCINLYNLSYVICFHTKFNVLPYFKIVFFLFKRMRSI